MAGLTGACTRMTLDVYLGRVCEAGYRSWSSGGLKLSGLTDESSLGFDWRVALGSLALQVRMQPICLGSRPLVKTWLMGTLSLKLQTPIGVTIIGGKVYKVSRWPHTMCMCMYATHMHLIVCWAKEVYSLSTSCIQCICNTMQHIIMQCICIIMQPICKSL